MKRLALILGSLLCGIAGFSQVVTSPEPDSTTEETVVVPGPNAKVENDTRFELHEVVETRVIHDQYIVVIRNGEEEIIPTYPDANFIGPEEEEKE